MSANSKELSFAVIGCGILARSAHIPNLLQTPGARLHTCCDLSDASLEACKPFNPVKLSKDFKATIHDPEIDALIVATTEAFRVPIIEEAAKAGKPVYCEKPLADSLDNALQMQKLVEESGIPFCLGHNRRCSPAMVEAQELFSRHMQNPEPCAWRFNREGWEQIDVGSEDGLPVVNIRINDDWHSWKPVHVTSEINRKYGLLLSECTHFVDLACWFIGSKPKQVFTTGTGVLNHALTLKFENGGLATITMGSNGTFGYPKELLEASGKGAMVVVDHMLEVRTGGIASAPAVKKYPMLNDVHPQIGAQGGLHGWLEKRRHACELAAEKGDPMLQFTAEPDKGHKRMLSEFIKEIHGERAPVSPIQNGVLAVRICLAAVESVSQGRVVDLDEIRQ